MVEAWQAWTSPGRIGADLAAMGRLGYPTVQGSSCWGEARTRFLTDDLVRPVAAASISFFELRQRAEARVVVLIVVALACGG